jgi:plasmid maintenance system antidote protein VapI
MIRRRGLTKTNVTDDMSITRPTLLKLLEDTNLLNGYQRTKLATTLGVPAEVIDALINLKEADAITITDEILNLIKPLKNDKN